MSVSVATTRAATHHLGAARLGLCALIACAGFAISACAPTREMQGAHADRASPTSGPNSDLATDSIEQLRRLAARIPGGDRDIAPPLAELRPIDPDDNGRALKTLRSLRPEDLIPPETDPAADGPDPEKNPPQAKTEALRLYAEARLALADGEVDRAIGLLDNAVIREPGSPELWRALGDARRTARYDNSAGAAYRRAATLGITEPQALLLAGINARVQGEPAAATKWLLAAARAEPAHADPLVAFIANAILGELLIELGYTEAGVEALAIGISMPTIARVRTEVGREAADVQRRLGSLRLMLGDALVRLGRASDAVAAYEDARGLPGAEGVRERLIYALRTSGNDAGAAIVLLEELRGGAAVSSDTARLLGELAAGIRPRSLVADAVASIDDRGSASRRADLTVARAGALRTQDALDLLTRSLTAADGFASPSAHKLLRAGIEKVAREDNGKSRRAVRWLIALIDREPRLAADAARALAATPGLPAGLSGLIENSGVQPERAMPLLAEIALLHRDTESIRALIDRQRGTGSHPDDDPVFLARAAALGAAIGDWGVVNDSIRALRRLDAPRALARALNAAQRPGKSLEVLRDIETRSVDDLLTRSTLESAVGDPARALADLEAARDLDPIDERVYAALLSFHGTDGPGPDDDAVTAVGRQLRSVIPESRLLRTMLAGELLRRRLIDDAAAITLPLYRADPTDAARQDAVLQLWRTRSAAALGERNEIDEVRAIASAHANDPGSIRLLAGGLVLGDRPAEAETAISVFATATGDCTLASLREQIIRDGLDDPDRAEALALERLGGDARSIGASVELLTLHADACARGDATPARFESMEDALRSIPRAARLNAAQRAAIVRGVSRAAIVFDTERRQGGDTEANRDPLLGLLSWTADRDLAIAPGIHELRLVLLSERGDAAQALILAAEHAVVQQTEGADLRRAFLRRAVDLLVARGEPDAAFEWLRDRAIGGDAPRNASGRTHDTDAIQEWFRLVIVIGQTDPDAAESRARAMLEALLSADAIATTWNVVRPEGPSWSTPIATADAGAPEKSGTETAADLAYVFALYAPDPNGGGEARTRYLRLALAYDDAHPWAANDLGYTMLESGGDLAEAERLIEIAYRGKPDEANIVDSLGWVRYHRGKIDDTVDPETGKRRLGAVSLLQQAAELSGPTDDGVVDDHLGDALYAAGRTEDAIVAWRRSARLANAALSRLRATGRVDGVRSDEIADLAVRAIMKPNAIQLGQPPAVEPQRGLDTPGTEHADGAAIDGEELGRESLENNAQDDE